MGRHSAERLPARELRGSYNRLLEAYGRLLREHRRLEAEHAGLLKTVPPRQPSTEVELWRPAGHLATGHEPLSVDAACEMVRTSGLLTSAGG
jgi:hypothetical protein